MKTPDQTSLGGGRPESVTDQAYLDGLFSKLLEDSEEGRETDLEPYLSERPDLFDGIHSLAELARNVAISPNQRDEPPAEVPGYTILTDIGRGGMGRVFLARQESAAGRTVAVKVLPSHHGQRSAKERLRREAQAISALQHGHIVRVYDVVSVRDSQALVMEFIDGGSLHQLIEAISAAGDLFVRSSGRGRMEFVAETLGAPTAAFPGIGYPQFVARLGLELSDALHAVHSTGILHRDVKPSNVLLRRDGTALLSDFGLAQEVRPGGASTLGGFAGTPAYSSPEQLRGAERLDVRSDVCSLGATLFHALTLRRPYAGDSAVQVLRSIDEQTRGGAGPRLRGPMPVPRDLETIVRKAMDPDRARRYQTPADLAADLSRFLENRPIRAKPASIWSHATKFVRRNRLSVSTGALVAIGAGIISGALIFRANVLPRWSSQALLSARSIVFRPSALTDVFNFEFWELPLGDRFGKESQQTRRVLAARYRAALAAYEQAIRYGDSSETTLAERDVAAILASRFSGDQLHTRIALGEAVSAYLSGTSNPASRGPRPADWWSSLSPDVGAEDFLRRLSTRELRQIGLLAFDLGDTATAIGAWSELERRGVDDAFGAGVLGCLYLINERPALAYARLQRAILAYPGVGDMIATAADAAVACGDLVRGRWLLDLARQNPDTDSFALRRVQFLLRFGEGDVGGVTREVCAAFERGENGKTVSAYLAYQVARRVQALGRADHLIELAAYSCDGDPRAIRALRLLLPLADRFWLEASPEVRRDLVVSMPCRAPDNFSWRSRFIDAWKAACGETKQPNASLDALLERYASLYDRDLPALRRPSLSALEEPLRTTVAEWVVTGDGPPPAEAIRQLRDMAKGL